MPTDLLVEDSLSLAAVDLTDVGTIWTQSSGLAFTTPAQGKSVVSIEDHVDRATHSNLLKSVLAVRPDIHDAFLSLEDNTGLEHISHCCGRTVYSLLVQLASKAFMLDRWLAAVSMETAIVAGSPNLSAVRNCRAATGEYDHIYAALVDAMEPGHAPRLVETPMVPRDRFMASFSHVTRSDRIFNSLNRPISSLAFKFWKKLRRPVGSNHRGTLLLLRENELIEEAFLPLARDGWRIVDKPVDDIQRVAADAPHKISELPAFARIWDLAASDFLGAPMNRAAKQLFLTRVQTLVADYPGWLEAVRTRVDGWRKEYGGHPWVTLSTGLYAPLHRLHDACLRDAGATVVCTDHGSGIGLLKRLDDLADDYIGFSDMYLTFNPEIAETLGSSARGKGLRISCVGSPTEMFRARLPRVQRAVMRRVLGIPKNTSILMYVTSIGLNNLVQGFGMGTDGEYTEFQNQLIDTLDTFDGKAVIKPYPAHRFADPEKLWVRPLPEGVGRLPFGEFRHSRWAADILVLDVHSSTISWALGSGRPLIYVDNPTDPLTERAAAALKKSVFYVDGRDPAWRKALAEILSTDLAELKRRWLAMSDNRRAFAERYALGPYPGAAGGNGDPGMRVRNMMREVAGNARPVRVFASQEQVKSSVAGVH